jgi:hypothetical protein
MQTFGWLAIPVLATVAAVAWVSWAARPRKTVTFDTLARYERFRAAVSRPSDHG